MNRKYGISSFFLDSLFSLGGDRMSESIARIGNASMNVTSTPSIILWSKLSITT